ncbi:ribulose-5-phosphate 3-epimerase [Verrucomicrobium sp. GAS474]|uniref:ribulose-phosphate 3-epimerase n=1 Tax=Verrucomicrobium sp. GAS474 TaxID=1882831 RepID=UPI0008793810|nr:ribulose-phosphate 3-epimerase [Verrucomicrobium sp. GAS474]SDU27163.1 ribulose-5-phosphate 3-epimerase [Verrucomicrobium sp. GAS474]
MKPILLAPSILAADYGNIERDVRAVEAAGVDCLHVDIMDGHFVPNMTFGPDFVAMLRRITRLPLDVHLMIQQPDRYVRSFIEAGADTITIHLEAYHDVGRTLDLIKSMGCRAGIAVNPLTLIEKAEKYMKRVDLVLCMTVNPGFGGQPFIMEVLEKVRFARLFRDQNNLNYDIEVDGGLTADTIGPAVVSGANLIVAGSSIFGKQDIPAAVKLLRQKAAEANAAG